MPNRLAVNFGQNLSLKSQGMQNLSPLLFLALPKGSNTNMSQTNVISPNKKECISGGVVQATLSFRFTLQSNSPLFLAGGDLWLLWFTFDVSVYDHVAVQIVDSL